MSESTIHISINALMLTWAKQTYISLIPEYWNYLKQLECFSALKRDALLTKHSVEIVILALIKPQDQRRLYGYANNGNLQSSQEKWPFLVFLSLYFA